MRFPAAFLPLAITLLLPGSAYGRQPVVITTGKRDRKTNVRGPSFVLR